MSVSEDEGIIWKVDYDTSPADAKLAMLAGDISRVEGERQKVEVAVTRTTQSSYGMFHAVTSSFQSMVGLFSDALTPLQQALLNAVFAAVDVMTAIATSQYTNPYTVAIGISMTIASAALGIAGAALAQQGMNAAKGSIDEAAHYFQAFGGMLGGFLA